MIFLHKSDLLGEGTARLVYQHPDDGRKCIKVVTHQKLLLKKKHRGIRGFLLPLSYFDPTRFETHFFQKLDARRDDEIFRYLPRCYGSVSTNLGSGMTFDRVGYQNLESYLTNNPFDPTMEKKLMELRDFFIRKKIHFSDWRTSNFVVQENHEKSTYKIFVVDGFEYTEFIPITRIPYFSRRKMLRRAERMISALKKSAS